MKKFKPILEYPLVVMGLSEDEKAAFEILRHHPLMPGHMHKLLVEYFPEFSGYDPIMLQEMIDFLLLFMADSGALQKYIDRLKLQKSKDLQL